MTKRSFSSKGYLSIGLLGLITLVAGFGGWATFANISGAVIASGEVEVDQNRQVVQHPDGGVVAEIAVDEGDLVQAGDLLVQLDDEILRSELVIIESRLFEVRANIARLISERDNLDEITFQSELLENASSSPEIQDLISGQNRLFLARKTSLSRQLEQLEKRSNQILNQVQGIEAQREALERQIELIATELENQQELFDKGLTQASTLLNLQREEASLDGRRGELIASAAQSAERITEIEIEVTRISANRREEAITQLREMGVRERELAEQRRAVKNRLGRLEIRAPVSGIVYSKQVFTPRSVIRSAEPLMFLIPQDRPLVVAAQIPPIHVDQVFVSQEVIVKFSAFDARTTPELTGTVVQVSADAFLDERSQTSFYRAEIRLSEEEIAKLPEGLVMIPGMPVETFVKTDDRSPLAYLVKPLTDYFARAFREG